MLSELVGGNQSGGDSDGAHTVGACGANVVGMIADQRHGTGPVNPALLPGMANRDADQSCTVAGKLGERSEPQVSL